MTHADTGGCCQGQPDKLAAMIGLGQIRAAAQRISGKVHHTPLFSSTEIGSRAGVRLFLKDKNFQKTASFKPRGASKKVLSLPHEEPGPGPATGSDGHQYHGAARGRRRTPAARAS